MRIEPTFQFKSLITEVKAFSFGSIRRVRDPEYWHLPYGTPLVGKGDGKPLDLLVFDDETFDKGNDFVVVKGKSGTYYRVSWWDDDPKEWFAQTDEDADNGDVLLSVKGKTQKDAMEKALQGVQKHEESLQASTPPPAPKKPKKPQKAKKAKKADPQEMSDDDIQAEIEQLFRDADSSRAGKIRYNKLIREKEARKRTISTDTTAVPYGKGDHGPQGSEIAYVGTVPVTKPQENELDYINETASASAIFYGGDLDGQANPAHVGVDDWRVEGGKLIIDNQQGWDHLARELDHYIGVYEDTAEDEYDAGMRRRARAKARVLHGVLKKMPPRPHNKADANRPSVGQIVSARTEKGQPAKVRVESIDGETPNSFLVTGRRIGKRGGESRTKEKFVIRKATPTVSDDISRQPAQKVRTPVDAMARWFDQLQEVEQIRSEARQAKTRGHLTPEQRADLDKRVFLSERIMVSDLPHISVPKDEAQEINAALRKMTDADLSDDYGSLAILAAIPHFVALWEKALKREEDLLAKGATRGDPAMIRVSRSLMRHEAAIHYGITLALKRASDRPKVSDADGEALSVGNKVWIDAAGPNLPSTYLGYPATVTGITPSGRVRVRIEGRIATEDREILVDHGKERMVDPKYLTQQRP